MYKVVWDKDLNGVLLVDGVESSQEIIPPRPVFYEELDLLGLNNFWEYPKCEEPLLWSIGRRYYYKGELVAEVRGGNIFEAPKVILTDSGNHLKLEPINIKALIENNESKLKVIEGEAIDFISDTYKKYKDKVDFFVVSFSGGKDSQVVLDLVSRALSPDDYIVIFTDTTMEIPPTYEVYEKTKEYYTSLYPNLKFYVARNERHSYELWKIFGPPSRLIRWCCSVYKTSPQVRLLRSLFPEKEKLKILVFDGVRAEESARRSGYERIAQEVKHITVINSRVIINWTALEVFLYIFYRILKNNSEILTLNKGYRYGLNRVGCSICPFGSEWSEFIISKKFPELTRNYLEVINKYVVNLGVVEEEKIKEYIIKGNWKKRAGGKGININSGIILSEENSNIKAILMTNHRNFRNIFEWLKILGNFICHKKEDNTYLGEIKLKDGGIININFKLDHQKINFESTNVRNEVSSIIKKVLNKITYCVSCGVCEAECSNSAIKFVPWLEIDSNKCKHCYTCLNLNSFGCVLAKSVSIPKGGKFMKSYGLDKYSTFGMREAWIRDFFSKRDKWFEDNNLGPKQIDAFIIWLREAEILENTLKNKKISEIGNRLIGIFNKDETIVWEIIWINLFYNSKIVQWYLSNLLWNTELSKKDILNKLKDSFPNLSEGTLKNPLDALFNLFENNNFIGNILRIGEIKKIGNERIISKIGSDDIHPTAILYSLYRYAISKGKYKLTVSEFYKENNKDGGPYLIFGISRPALENILRGLQEKRKDLIKVDIVADLDNIYLSDSVKNYSQILEYMV